MGDSERSQDLAVRRFESPRQFDTTRGLCIDRSGLVTVFCGSTDIGQGSNSVLAYIVAEELGLDPMKLRIVTADTDLTPVDLGSYSSRVTVMTGNAAMQAAERAREIIASAVAVKLEVPAGRLVFSRPRGRTAWPTAWTRCSSPSGTRSSTAPR